MARGTQQRRPRFRRQPTVGMRLTKRDLAIIRAVAEHRFLNTNHLQAILEVDSRKGLTNRLSLLYHHGYLDRPKNQLEYFERIGSRPLVYGLAPKGARVLQDAGAEAKSYQTSATGRHHLQHSLLVADCLVALELSARAHNLDVLSSEEILARAPVSNSAQPSGWKISILHKRKRLELGVYPDAMFAVPGKRDHSLLFLEADRGTEALRRGDILYRSSIYKKFLLYWESAQQWRNKKTTPPYGFRYPRVLMVVSASQPRKRIRNMQSLARELAPEAPNFFLFAAHDELLAEDFLSFGWQNAKGEVVRLASS